MAVLMGHGAGATYFVPGNAGVDTPQPAPSTTFPSVIDGTPVRVVVLALSAAAGLTALHLAGFRFNIGVSG